MKYGEARGREGGGGDIYCLPVNVFPPQPANLGIHKYVNCRDNIVIDVRGPESHKFSLSTISSQIHLLIGSKIGEKNQPSNGGNEA